MPPGISCFNLKSFINDQQLRARSLGDDPETAAALRPASYSSNAQIGVVVEQPFGVQHHPVVNKYKIICHSTMGPLDPEADYVGMVLYFKHGAVDWHLNGVHCESGHVYYKKTADIGHYGSDHAQVHGKLYMSLFGEEPSDDVVASGFTIKQGLKWRFNSGTLNSWQKRLHIDRSEQKILKAAIERFASDTHSVYPVAKDPPETEPLLALATMMTEQMSQLLINEGQSVLPAKSTGRESIPDKRFLRKATVRISARCKWNKRKQLSCLCSCLVPSCASRSSMTIHITWQLGSKQKSITLCEYLHRTGYQLLLDIQDHTGKKASEHTLLYRGMELPLWESISNSGVCDGDTLTLQRTPASLRVLPSANHSALDFRSQLQVKHGGKLPTVAE